MRWCPVRLHGGDRGVAVVAGVGEHLRGLADRLRDAVHGGLELLLVVRGVRHVAAQDQHVAFRVHRRLRVAGLLEMPPVPGLHDPASGIREIVLVLRVRLRRRRLRIGAAHRFATFPPRGALRLLFLEIPLFFGSDSQ